MLQVPRFMIQENVPLKELTTMKVGGPARYLLVAETVEQVIEGLRFAEKNRLPVHILGGGSNTVISDEGFPGLVVVIGIKGISETEEKEGLITIGAGEEWDSVVGYAVKRNWAGIECLSAIPGSAGAAPVQNIGAYGQSVDASVIRVEAVEKKSKKVRTFTKNECNFSYRQSIFNTTRKNQYIITSFVLELAPNGQPNLTYENIKSYFEGKSATPTLQEVRQAVIEVRKRKGLVVMPNVESYQTAGSFFKNIVVDEKTFKNIENIVLRDRPNIPDNCCPDPWHWSLPDRKVKVAAACLVHCSEIIPGTREGNVGTSPKQTLAITNFGNATAAEIFEFSKKVQKVVKEKFGITLEIEPELVNF